MTIYVTRDPTRKMMHHVTVRGHRFPIDEPVSNGGDDAGPTAHDLYDSALGACKAMTVLWYANRKQIPIEGIQVSVDRDDSREREGVYRLTVRLAFTGDLTDAQRQELLAVADRCPLHKLMTRVTTEITTELTPRAVPDTPA